MEEKSRYEDNRLDQTWEDRLRVEAVKRQKRSLGIGSSIERGPERLRKPRPYYLAAGVALGVLAIGTIPSDPYVIGDSIGAGMKLTVDSDENDIWKIASRNIADDIAKAGKKLSGMIVRQTDVRNGREAMRQAHADSLGVVTKVAEPTLPWMRNRNANIDKRIADGASRSLSQWKLQEVTAHYRDYSGIFIEKQPATEEMNYENTPATDFRKIIDEARIDYTPDRVPSRIVGEFATIQWPEKELGSSLKPEYVLKIYPPSCDW